MGPSKQLFVLFILMPLWGYAQQSAPVLPVKVSHAEPIYYDLIRDLGARKGEKEWNVGAGMSSRDTHNMQSYLVEYEFAPINRLGFEVELPFSFSNYPTIENGEERARHRGLEGIKLATQYSFFVSDKWKTTLAVGFIYELQTAGSKGLRPGASVHNPFLIVAKKWGSLHTLLYTGPVFESGRAALVVNTNIHYVLQGGNFIGIEFNKEIAKGDFSAMIRPQVKLVVSPEVAVGIAVGVPAGNNDNNLDFMLRWIYQPSKKVRR